VPVFCILESNGVFKVDVVKDVTAASLLDLTIKTVRRGSIVYTEKFGSYNTLIFCGYWHMRVDYKKRYSSGKVYLNGIEDFWSFAKESLIKFHRVSQAKFSFY
jgi:transposase